MYIGNVNSTLVMLFVVTSYLSPPPSPLPLLPSPPPSPLPLPPLSPSLPSPDIGECAQLSFLQLQHNELTELPSTVGQLSHLKRLGLQYNKLSDLPAELCQCSELTEIGLESNTLTSLPVGWGGWVWSGVGGCGLGWVGVVCMLPSILK